LLILVWSTFRDTGRLGVPVSPPVPPPEWRIASVFGMNLMVERLSIYFCWAIVIRRSNLWWICPWASSPPPDDKPARSPESKPTGPRFFRLLPLSCTDFLIFIIWRYSSSSSSCARALAILSHTAYRSFFLYARSSGLRLYLCCMKERNCLYASICSDSRRHLKYVSSVISTVFFLSLWLYVSKGLWILSSTVFSGRFTYLSFSART